MQNWDEDDTYCDAAADFGRRSDEVLGIPCTV
jgi:hypothetical protein